MTASFAAETLATSMVSAMNNHVASLQKQDHRPTLSSPPSVSFLASRKIGTDADGTVVLRRGTALSEPEKASAESHLAQLRFCLHNAASDTDLMMVLALLFAPYESRERTPDAEKLRLMAYLQALQGYPLWAVRDAVQAWHRGEHSEPVDNQSFPPAPPRLVRLVNIAMGPAQEAERKVAGLLRARLEDEHPADSLTPEKRAASTVRIDALVADFTKSLLGKDSVEAAE
jgi:hypothetical protein